MTEAFTINVEEITDKRVLVKTGTIGDFTFRQELHLVDEKFAGQVVTFGNPNRRMLTQPLREQLYAALKAAGTIL